MRAAVVYAQKTAIIYNGHSYTFEQLADRARRLANALLESYEIEKGDRVGILCLNHPVYIEAHYAVPATGGIMVPINTRLSADEIEYIIEHSGTKVLLVDEESVQLLTEKARKQVKTIVISDHPEKNEYERVLSNSSNKLLWRELYMEQDELAVISINYTSGSTARPKGVQALYRGCYLAGVTVAGQLGISSESVLLSSSPMFHCNGK
jgi:fatty-acyl-CoA synthase